MALPWKPFLSFGEMRLLGLALVGVLAPTAPIAAHAGRLDAKRGVAFRPEFQAPWIGQPHVTALALRRLVPEESGALVHGLLAARWLFRLRWWRADWRGQTGLVV